MLTDAELVREHIDARLRRVTRNPDTPIYHHLAERMARQGYGWEDIKVASGVTEQEARALVFDTLQPNDDRGTVPKNAGSNA